MIKMWKRLDKSARATTELLRMRNRAVREGDVAAGVPYFELLVSIRGMAFTLMPFAHQSKVDVQKAGEWLRGSRDVVRLEYVRIEPGLDVAGIASDPDYLALRAEPDWDARRRWVPRIADQRVLAWLAMTDSESDVAERAVSRVTEQGLIRALATSASHAAVRRLAVDQLADEALCGAISQTDPEFLVRIGAVRGVKDPAILAGVARHDPAPLVRLEAVEGIEDRDVLSDIRRSDSDEDVRGKARWCELRCPTPSQVSVGDLDDTMPESQYPAPGM